MKKLVAIFVLMLTLGVFSNCDNSVKDNQPTADSIVDSIFVDSIDSIVK